uniref:Protein NipSnap homolog 1 n=1 Tax=Phallusia mammillata TaxID=59560 RepID=A0A6F9DN46_9ASCI|nr:protein NipSnap homolog 1 [Phallusia mammillata]
MLLTGSVGYGLLTFGMRKVIGQNSIRCVSSADVKNFFMPKVAPRTDSQSSLLTKKDVNHLYKIQFHNVKPEALEDYRNLCGEFIPQLSKNPDLPLECVGSWSSWYGEQDQVVHLWRYKDGFPSVRETNSFLGKEDWYKTMRKDRSKMLNSRSNELLYEFSFWNEVVPREGPNIYELRTYHLKPGTLLEWANNWARGIRARQQSNEAVGGFFSEIGPLSVVHHLWAYKDLQHRKDTRQSAWEKPGWDDVVYYTVPLIQQMSSKILTPLPHSPLQ